MRSRSTFAVAGVAAVAVAAVIAGCGSSGSGSSTTSGSTSGGSAMTVNHTTTVSTKQVPGIGTVLVNRSGMALYTPVQEANGMIRCTGSCTTVWIPLTSGAKPTASGATATFGVIRRPDGTQQVTANGKPLYTFIEDTNGNVTGNGARDAFNGDHFTWHVVLSNGTPAGSSAAPSGASSGSSGSSGSSSMSGGGSNGGSGY